MNLCWKYSSKQRPTFNEIIEILVPDLSPQFTQLSYFFSESNRRHDLEEAAEESCPLTGAGDVVPDAIMMAEINSENISNSDPEMGLPCNHISNSPRHGNSSKNSNSESKSKKRPKSLNQSSPSASNRNHNCSVSSPSSSDGSKSDGSKASVKSNGSVYSHMNGVANGHINLPIPRTTEC
jgi:hypothetical protein